MCSYLLPTMKYLFLFLLCCATAHSQDLSANKKAQKLYEKAQEQTTKSIEEAIKTYQEAIAVDTTFAEAHWRLGLLYDTQLKRDNALFHFEQALRLKPNAPYFLSIIQTMGNYYLRKGIYNKALFYFEQYLSLIKTDNMKARQVRLQAEKCRFAQTTIQAPLPWKVAPLDTKFNNKTFQSFAVLTADQETMVFTEMNKNEDLMISHWEDNEWTSPQSISDKINTYENEGTCSISADGRTMVFTSCNRRGSFGGCDLYFSQKAGEQWSIPENMGKQINTTWWESQPSLSADGQRLYFSSDRPKGQGNKDLWMSDLDSLGQWSIPQNLGASINTPYDEIAPFIHANGTTLFFSSDGHLGLGGQDFFMTELLSSSSHQMTKLASPVNLGYPLNDYEDQVGLFIVADNKKGYYTSDNRAEGYHENSFEPNRKLQINTILIPNSVAQRFKACNYLKGKVKNAVSGKPVAAAIELYALGSKQKIATFQSDEQTGEYLSVLHSGGEYGVYINAQGYLFKSLTFNYTQQQNPFGKVLDILLEPIQKDKQEVLNNIYFATGQYVLEDKSKVALDKLSQLLKDNPSLKIEIAGHTDDRGKDIDNQKLSLQRAKAVVEYLLKTGIATERLTYQGYGKARPLVPNITEEDRSINRRIEMKVL
jgi:outer membrane protein OmpA-like peptidoglycan-associated protein